MTTAQGTAAGFVPPSTTGAGATAELEIELANGCAVRLTGSVDSGMLQATIPAVGQIARSSIRQLVRSIVSAGDDRSIDRSYWILGEQPGLMASDAPSKSPRAATAA
jgi:hypothetical protein